VRGGRATAWGLLYCASGGVIFAESRFWSTGIRSTSRKSRAMPRRKTTASATDVGTRTGISRNFGDAKESSGRPAIRLNHRGRTEGVGNTAGLLDLASKKRASPSRQASSSTGRAPAQKTREAMRANAQKQEVGGWA